MYTCRLGWFKCALFLCGSYDELLVGAPLYYRERCIDCGRAFVYNNTQVLLCVVCLCVCCVYLCVFVCMCLCHCVSLCMCVFVCVVHLCVFVHMCMHVYVPMKCMVDCICDIFSCREI